ncbi:helix-turn-helix transcriptional regulator [Shewanella sp. NIFS-20-20]|uniref:ArsR/SmtB family transcription factor n=1 Tax=Shewanella sp. NIFS-20-20 TaxID=2853806 RepID=UPI001C4480B8|nr:metalloregulator ArsR/SmtB family transcription factor [Shewanella sp. NIFS-20-20]MBV7315372.1 metalloregulator ArsR/SmtB family transcription factor [Shewanella sp. NIFS-20-20]
MNIEIAAKVLKELGHPTRLALFKTLVKGGAGGITVGQIQEALQIPGSTLSHHISAMISAGIISQRREGRVLYCVPDYLLLQNIVDFLQDECCAGL